MIYVFGSHPVQDFATWKPIFDSDQPRAKAAGIILQKLFRGSENPNEVSMLFTVPSKEAFEQFIQEPTLGERMQQAGVLAPPVFEFYEEV